MLKWGQLDIKKVPDITFIGEGVKAERLTKEFFTLVMDALTIGTVFLLLLLWFLKDKVITWY